MIDLKLRCGWRITGDLNGEGQNSSRLDVLDAEGVHVAGVGDVEVGLPVNGYPEIRVRLYPEVQGG